MHLRPTCAQCVYWIADHTTGGGTTGHCHRYPPHVHVNPVSGAVVQKFPTTERHSWCGEWSDDAARWQKSIVAAAAKG